MTILPEPDGYATMTPNGTIIVPRARYAEYNGYAVFTADQMREFARAERLRVIEECAKLARAYSGIRVSDAILALKDKTNV